MERVIGRWKDINFQTSNFSCLQGSLKIENYQPGVRLF
jgi:hypothetical protein